MPRIHMQMKCRCRGPTSEKMASHLAWKNSGFCAEESTWACRVCCPYAVGNVVMGEARVNREQQEGGHIFASTTVAPSLECHTHNLGEAEENPPARWGFDGSCGAMAECGELCNCSSIV